MIISVHFHSELSMHVLKGAKISKMDLFFLFFFQMDGETLSVCFTFFITLVLISIMFLVRGVNNISPIGTLFN